ncbi:hypothetical protein T11_17627 [Trichinella zimbabwensis]|uniref:Uncharacterized protein n=1 Tax=Trichinella zimbabwensis TaxID=268475 RepID=A0A0V1HGX6_9BILA|nr:hypothetical protein T11_17627 [Trichinella zimbabwensis]
MHYKLLTKLLYLVQKSKCFPKYIRRQFYLTSALYGLECDCLRLLKLFQLKHEHGVILCKNFAAANSLMIFIALFNSEGLLYFTKKMQAITVMN